MEKITTVAKFVSEVPSKLSYGPWKTHASLLNILNSYLCRKQNQTISKTELLVILLGGLTSLLAGSKHLGSVLWIETEDVSEPKWNPFLSCHVSAHNWALSAAGENVLNIYVSSFFQNSHSTCVWWDGGCIKGWREIARNGWRENARNKPASDAMD